MYVLAKNSSLVALNAVTGKEIWIHTNLRGITGRGINYWESEDRKDRRLVVCSTCGGYLKTIDLAELSPFPLLSISDIETTDLDVAAMEHGYHRPALKDFTQRR